MNMLDSSQFEDLAHKSMYLGTYIESQLISIFM